MLQTLWSSTYQTHKRRPYRILVNYEQHFLHLVGNLIIITDLITLGNIAIYRGHASGDLLDTEKVEAASPAPVIHWLCGFLWQPRG